MHEASTIGTPKPGRNTNTKEYLNSNKYRAVKQATDFCEQPLYKYST